MTWKSPKDVIPWVGLYVCMASLVCTLAMAADVFNGFRQRKLWFPCRFFTINAASITLIAIAMKLLVDLNENKLDDADNLAKIISIFFLVTMLANFLPSLGLMDDKELLLNMVALGILIFTITLRNIGFKCFSFGKAAIYLHISQAAIAKRFIDEPNASNSNVMSNIEEYTGYVLQNEVDVKLPKKILRNVLKSITRLLHESQVKEPRNLIKLLKNSTGFNGVVEFDSDQVPPLHKEKTPNCWSLVVVTLTAIALALPKISNDHVKGLLASVGEGLKIVTHTEEILNANGDLVKTRKAARRVWTDIEVYGMWLQIDLQKKARKGKTSKEILQWLGDEAVKIVIQFLRFDNGSLDHSVRKFIAASSMYRCSRTVLFHCNEQQNWPKDEELFELISTRIADLLLACFTNLPRVITMKCHHDAIEKREESIRTAAQLLGKSKKILKILKASQLPNLDMDSMAYIDKWHALYKNQMPDVCSSSARIHAASSSSSESYYPTRSLSKMEWKSPADAMPWVGLYDSLASLICILAMAADVFHGFRQRKLWFPCRFFTMNAASITLIAIAMKLPVDLTTGMSDTLTVPASRRNLQNRYNDLHMLGSNRQEINFSFKELISYVKKYWMMTETGNPQFAIACSPVCSAFGVTCSVLAVISSFVLMSMFVDVSHFRYGKSDYQWSVDVIVILQSIGAIVGSIAPVFRCLSATSHFNLSKKWSKNHLNVFRVEKHWIERLQRWKRIYLCSHIPGRHFKKVFHIIKNMILNVCIALQITVVTICNTICLIPGSLMILFSCFWYLFKSTLKMIKVEPNASNSNMMSDMEDYTGYVLQTESEVKHSNRIVRNALNSITRLLQESEEKEPTNLINLLKKYSRGFNGVIEFDSVTTVKIVTKKVKRLLGFCRALDFEQIGRNHVEIGGETKPEIAFEDPGRFGRTPSVRPNAYSALVRVARATSPSRKAGPTSELKIYVFDPELWSK
ncbi:hypothetical protein LXL04_032449 [Taraxacum kok-saghyz]